jgi:MFS transporter, DHA1 family, tetracycline resistance protein
MEYDLPGLSLFLSAAYYFNHTIAIERAMDTSVFRNKPFTFILITAFLATMGIGLIMPVIPFIVSRYVDPGRPNDTALFVGILNSLYAFCQFFAAPVLGALSDKYGRRPVLLLCLAGSGVGYVLFGIGGGLGVLIIARIVAGMAGGDLSTAMAYISDVTEPAQRGRYFGIVGAVAGLGFILGPSVGWSPDPRVAFCAPVRGSGTYPVQCGLWFSLPSREP